MSAQDAITDFLAVRSVVESEGQPLEAACEQVRMAAGQAQRVLASAQASFEEVAEEARRVADDAAGEWAAFVAALEQRLDQQGDLVSESIKLEVDESLDQALTAAQESLQEVLEDLTQAAESWTDATATQLAASLDSFRTKLEDGVQRHVNEMTDSLARETLGQVTSELGTAVADAGIQVALSGVLSPLYPTLIAIRAVAEALKQALILFRMF